MYFRKKLNVNFSYNKIITLGVFVRLMLLILVFNFYIPYGPEAPISPLHFQRGVDLEIYLDQIFFYTSINGIRELYNIFYDIYFLNNDPIIRPVGPIYPIFLYLLDYRVSTLFHSLFLFLLLN